MCLWKCGGGNRLERVIWSQAKEFGKPSEVGGERGINLFQGVPL